MEYGWLGGERVSLIGFGAWQAGSRVWGWGREYGRRELLEALLRSFELGVNFVDTAEAYGSGVSERLVGEAVRAWGRSGVLVATKFSPHRVTEEGIMKAARRSLERLGVSSIDLYQLHWPSPILPIKKAVRSMERLVDLGLVRMIGVCNLGPRELREAVEAAARHRLASDQVRYNLVQRDGEKVLPICVENDLTLIAYSPLAQGLLTGKYTQTSLPRGLHRRMSSLSTPESLRALQPLLEALRRIGEKHGKTPAQVALNWLVSKPKVVAIPGAKSKAQAEENIGAVGWRLGEHEVRELEEAYLRFKPSRLKTFIQVFLRALMIL